MEILHNYFKKEVKISECFKHVCCKYRCKQVHPKCVHAIILGDDGENVQVMSGDEIYKILDKNHSEYDHFYKLYNVEYLEQEAMRKQLEQEETKKLIEQMKQQRQLEIEISNNIEFKISKN